MSLARELSIPSPDVTRMCNFPKVTIFKNYFKMMFCSFVVKCNKCTKYVFRLGIEIIINSQFLSPLTLT